MAGGRGKRKRSRSSEAVTGARDKGENEGWDRTWSSSGENHQGEDENRVNASPTSSVLEAIQGGNEEHESNDDSSDNKSNACANGGNSPNEEEANSGNGRSDYSSAAHGRNARHEHDVNSGAVDFNFRSSTTAKE